MKADATIVIKRCGVNSYGGGGGNRTPVPRQVSTRLYECSPSIESRASGSAGQDPSAPACCWISLPHPRARFGSQPAWLAPCLTLRARRARGPRNHLRSKCVCTVVRNQFFTRCFMRPPGNLNSPRVPPLPGRYLVAPTECHNLSRGGPIALRWVIGWAPKLSYSIYRPRAEITHSPVTASCADPSRASPRAFEWNRAGRTASCRGTGPGALSRSPAR
jgi:hypothetical protein